MGGCSAIGCCPTPPVLSRPRAAWAAALDVRTKRRLMHAVRPAERPRTRRRRMPVTMRFNTDRDRRPERRPPVDCLVARVVPDHNRTRVNHWPANRSRRANHNRCSPVHNDRRRHIHRLMHNNLLRRWSRRMMHNNHTLRSSLVRTEVTLTGHRRTHTRPRLEELDPQRHATAGTLGEKLRVDLTRMPTQRRQRVRITEEETIARRRRAVPERRQHRRELIDEQPPVGVRRVPQLADLQRAQRIRIVMHRHRRRERRPSAGRRSRRR